MTQKEIAEKLMVSIAILILYLVLRWIDESFFLFGNKVYMSVVVLFIIIYAVCGFMLRDLKRKISLKNNLDSVLIACLVILVIEVCNIFIKV